MEPISPERLERAYQTALAALLAERHPDGYWVGELSTSALSTATAVGALTLVQKQRGTREYQALIDGGIAWLTAHQNPDGGWGDTVKSFSNISTTMLCRAAFHLVGGQESGIRSQESEVRSQADAPLRRAEAWLFERHGTTPAELAEAVRQRYGKDRTFSVPILTMCALAGLVPWREVPPLPFELACLPQSWFRLVRLHVVSYALPALIAIGQVIYHHRPPWNPFTRVVRWLSKKRSLRVLARIQPSNGGFLEATPLTSFVTMSLAACGLADHVVARKGAEFIAGSVRPDGSWPIDTNLSTWVTTLAVNAVDIESTYDGPQSSRLSGWLAQQQYHELHAYTGAAPGGWAWTPLPGGVPDADDTSGALLAEGKLLHNSLLAARGYFSTWAGEERFFKQMKIRAAPSFGPFMGLSWLLALQNTDGGWPTFCRGWGHLPFDRSGADLTAHAIRAIRCYRDQLNQIEDKVASGDWPGKKHGSYWLAWKPFEAAIERGFWYLARVQRPDGSWLPLWFGNQHAPHDENPTYGTARVLAAYRDLYKMDSEPARRGVAWLLAAQNADGGWGGAATTPSSIEETALAVEVLLDASPLTPDPSPLVSAVNNGLAWLVQQ